MSFFITESKEFNSLQNIILTVYAKLISLTDEIIIMVKMRKKITFQAQIKKLVQLKLQSEVYFEKFTILVKSFELDIVYLSSYSSVANNFCKPTA